MATTHTQHGRDTGRSLRGLLADSAYAYLGLGGAAVELVRSIDRLRVTTPQRARAIGKEAPERLRHLVEESVSSTLSLPGLAVREFDDLARRGRDLVGAIRTNSTTLEAVDRTRTARSRVKAAGTSVGRAAESAVQATERAATIVADRTESTERHDIEVQASKVEVKTRRTAPGRQPTARRDAADRAPARPRRTAPVKEDRGQSQTGPYEERTVEELQERARELGIEGRASMTKDELIKALRDQRS